LIALYHYPKNPPRWMVLCEMDTYHYYNLPDLVFVVRDALMGMCPSPWLQRLFNMFLCGKRYRRLATSSLCTIQLSAAVVNTLHGLLLGLYPFNERRMDITTRAVIAGRMHAVLTGGNHVAFIESHQNLMCMSLMEYIINAVDDFCPIEWGLLNIPVGAKSRCLAVFESFRETHVAATVDDDPEGWWASLDSGAHPVIATLVKFFKSATFYQHRPKPVLPVAIVRHFDLALGSRVIQNSASIFGQLRAAMPHVEFQQAAALEEIWNALFIRRLPAHTINQQIEVLERKGRMCSMVEEELQRFPVCMACALTRRADVLKGLFRHNCDDGALVCNECMRPEYVVRVNMLGRVLFVRDRAIALCDQCLKPKPWDAVCQCRSGVVAKPAGCCVCLNPNVFSTKDVVDLENVRMVSVGFCYKHSLTCVLSDATVYDFPTLEKEIHRRGLKCGAEP
jgi:hypothetical protein